MLAGASKIILCAMTVLLGASPQAVPPVQSQAHQCTEAAPLSFDAGFYSAQTRDTLLQLGTDNHPVGLYWLAHRDLKTARIDAAIDKLQKAAQQGLPDAYSRLAEIYESQKKYSQAETARKCAKTLNSKI